MAMIAGTGMTYHGERKGPLAIADEIGLDVVLDGLEKLFSSSTASASARRACCAQKVRAGHLGVKTGRGFHEYA